MGGKSGDAKMRVASYYMSIHFGICHGPVDAIEGIYCGEKKAWEGSFTGHGRFNISKRNLFGGEKKEGGLSGTVYVLPGGPDQVMPEDMAARVGLTPRSMPAYRGITSLFFSARAPWNGVYPDPNDYPDPRDAE